MAIGISDENAILPAMPPRCQRLGVFGGTFDPIHIGHLMLAEEARVRLSLDYVVFVPAKVSPLKLQATFGSARDRLNMVLLATQDNPYFRVSCVDLNRPGPSFTVDTLRAIKAQFGDQTQLFFILGMDSLRSLKVWRQPQEIIALTRLIAISRPSFAVDLPALERDVPGISRATDVISSLQLGISSTDIRARLHQGLPIRYLVPATVEVYIRENALYT
jgi:nicotinate-nucleotide adenylyltransferase